MNNITPAMSLDRIVEAADGISRLRQFVVDAAFSGRLATKFSSQDENGNTFLASVVADERKLHLAASNGSDIQPADSIPQNWKWRQLGEIGRIFNGNSVSDVERSVLSRVKDGYPFIATKDVGYGSEPLQYENGLKVPFSNESYKVAHKEAVFICAEGGSAGKKCGITDRDVCFGNKLYAIELNEDINPRYVLLAYQSSAFYQTFAERMTGIIGGVSLREFNQISIPVPALVEQEQIVELVGSLMKIIDNLEIAKRERDDVKDKFIRSSFHWLLSVENSKEKESSKKDGDIRSQINHITQQLSSPAHVVQLRRAIASLAIRGRIVAQNNEDESVSTLLANIKAERDQLIQDGILRHRKVLPPVASDDVFPIPDSWSWVHLQDLLVFGPQNGISPRKSTRPNAPRAITLTATTSGNFDPRYFKTVDADIDKDSELWLQSGDLIFQRGNSREYVGIAAVYKGEANAFVYPDLMIKVRISKAVDIDYIHIFANSPFARNYFMKMATGAQSTMPKINQEILLALPIALPPKDEQLRIVSSVSSLMATCEQLNEGFRLHQLDTEKYLASIFGEFHSHQINEQKLVDTAPTQKKRDEMSRQATAVRSEDDELKERDRRGPVSSLEDLVECVKSFEGPVSSRELFGASGMGHSNDEIEKFFDLLRIARSTGNLLVSIGEGRVEDVSNED